MINQFMISFKIVLTSAFEIVFKSALISFYEITQCMMINMNHNLFGPNNMLQLPGSARGLCIIPNLVLSSCILCANKILSWLMQYIYIY